MDESEVLRLTRQHNPLADALRAARRVIDKPEKWIQDEYSNKGRYCMLGALGVVYGSQDAADVSDAKELLERVLGESVHDFNDAPQRTHAEVMAAFDMAIQRAERGEDHGIEQLFHVKRVK